MSDSLLKIALLCDWYLPHRGGIELQTHDLALQLSRLGHDVHIITPIPGSAEVDGIRVHRINAPLFPFFGFIWTARPFREMVALFAREGFDVVHCQASYVAPTAYGGAYLSQRLGIPTLVTFHSVLLHFAQVLAAANHCVRWSAWSVVFSAVSDVVKSETQELVGSRPVHVLSNGIDTSFWKASPPVWQNGGKPNAQEALVVSVMRFSPRKRGTALLRLIAETRSRLPETVSLKLVIVGEGRLRSYMERLIGLYCLEDTVELMGYQSRQRIREIFTQADVFVLTSVVESFGIAALEARCAGLPVVARESGVNAFIQNGREGFLARTDREMADHLVRLITDVQLRRSIARHNWETRPHFDWDVVIPKCLHLYQEAINLTSHANGRKS